MKAVAENGYQCQEFESSHSERLHLMGFSIAQYAALRPILWHLTHNQNLELIRKIGLLMPATRLTSVSLDGPRRGRQITPGIPVLRDQELLNEQCIEFESGYTMANLLSDLNKRVFFWS